MAYNKKGKCRNTGRTHFKKGMVPWNKGLKYKNPKHSKDMKKAWEEGKFKNRKINYKETAKKISATQQGIKLSEWKDFVSKENRKLRQCVKYLLWREAVFRRDKFTCLNCEKKGCYLEAHHIKPFALYKELRFNINNGVTLCRECHILLDSYRGRKTIKLGEVNK